MTSGSARVAIIDGGGANIASLQFALSRLGAESTLTRDSSVIREASHVILPGVGAAQAAMRRLRDADLDRLIPTLTQPVLGICLGLQLFFEHSEEESTDCLGILPGTVRKFEPLPGRPVPHMGWNQVAPVRESPLLADIAAGSYFYFVHSYAAPIGAWTAGQTEYGWPFTAVLLTRNFHATQFHPERSGAGGARVLRNFLSQP